MFSVMKRYNGYTGEYWLAIASFSSRAEAEAYVALTAQNDPFGYRIEEEDRP